MDNDPRLQAEVRRALEAITPPAPWLAARVAKGLGNRDGGLRMEVREPSPRWVSLVAAVLVAIFALATVVVVLASRALVPSGSVPASRGDRATIEYVDLVEAGDQGLNNAMGPPVCQGVRFDALGQADLEIAVAACRERIQNLYTATLKFEADLDRAHPPAQLAGKHAQLRADLARIESVHHRGLAYLDARDFAALAAMEPETAAIFADYNSDINAILATPRHRP